MVAQPRPGSSASSEPNGDERRRKPRFNMALDVAFGSAGGSQCPSQEALERSVTVNLSLGGLCLYSDILYPVGSELYCALTLPTRDTPIEITGTVAWFQKIDREAHGYKMGLEFGQMSKPDRVALEALLNHPPKAKMSRAKRLLLVDDDQELCLALKLRFESAGFEVLTASNGLDGLRKGRTERPDLIILDLMLPSMNGYEVCRLLKFDQKFRHIPIMVCSARSRREDRLMGEAVGADAYITKPFDGKTLIHQAEELLNAAAT